MGCPAQDRSRRGVRGVSGRAVSRRVIGVAATTPCSSRRPRVRSGGVAVADRGEPPHLARLALTRRTLDPRGQPRHSAAGGRRWPSRWYRVAEPRANHPPDRPHLTICGRPVDRPHRIPETGRVADRPVAVMSGQRRLVRSQTRRAIMPRVGPGGRWRDLGRQNRAGAGGPSTRPPPPISPTTCPCAHTGRARTSWREHPPETCGAPASRLPGPPATLTHRVSHAAQRADLPRVRPDRRRRDLGWQNRAGHHHPYHPPRAFAPTRVGRGPAGRTPTGDLRGTGVSAWAGRGPAARTPTGKTCGVSATPEN